MTRAVPRRLRTLCVGRERDAALREFTESIGSGRKLEIVLSRRPSFFDALEVEGEEPVVVVTLDEISGEILSVGVMSERSCYLDGQPQARRIGYLSSARIAENVRGGRILRDSFRELERQLRARRARLHLTTILSDNLYARRVLEPGRAGLPRYLPWGRIHSVFWPLAAHRGADFGGRRRMPGMELRRASAGDVPELLRFWRIHGSRRQFFPAFTAEDLESETGLLRGLRIGDVWLGIERGGGDLLGTLALWDQSAFRQWRILRFPPSLAWGRPLYNLLARIRGGPRLPAVGSAMRLRYGAGLCIRGQDPEILRALLHGVAREASARGPLWWGMAFHESDPFLPVALDVPHRALESRLYVVHWPEGREEAEGLDPTLCPHLELGAL